MAQRVNERIGMEGTVWVSGVGRGIGRATALAAAARGTAVAGVAHHGGPRLRALAQELARAGAPAVFVGAADVAHAAHLERWAATAWRRTGAPSLVIHAAGVLGPRQALMDVSPRQFAATLRTNTQGSLHWLQAVARHADRASPVVWLWLTSSVAVQGRAGWGPYAASKAALDNMAQTLADEWRAGPWVSIAVNPGGTRTDMRRQAYPHEDPTTLPSADDVAATLLRIAAAARAGQIQSGSRQNVRDWG